MVDVSAEFLLFVIDNVIVTWLHGRHVVNEGKGDRLYEIKTLGQISVFSVVSTMANFVWERLAANVKCEMN